MIRILLALCAAPAAVFLTACSPGSSGSGPASTPQATVSAAASPVADAVCQPALAHAAGSFNETLSSGGLSRTYILHVPAGYDGAKRVPLVLAYHGWTMFADQFAAYDGFDGAADKAGFAVVTPNGTGDPQAWNTGDAAGGADDVQFTKDLLAKVEGELCVDEDRVYAAGYSLGGGMALRAACDLPDRIAAAGVVEAVYPTCMAAVPLVAFHGTSDPIVPFDGGQTGTTGALIFPVVRRSVSEWARALGCDGLPLISHPNSEIELSTFQRCSYGTGDVLLYTVIGGGHTWPGAAIPLPENIVGKTTRQISATDVIWEFFAAHPRGH